MPSGPVGSVWRSGAWLETTWEAGSWSGGAVVQRPAPGIGVVRRSAPIDRQRLLRPRVATGGSLAAILVQARGQGLKRPVAAGIAPALAVDTTVAGLRRSRGYSRAAGAVGATARGFAEDPEQWLLWYAEASVGLSVLS